MVSEPTRTRSLSRHALAINRLLGALFFDSILLLGLFQNRNSLSTPNMINTCVGYLSSTLTTRIFRWIVVGCGSHYVAATKPTNTQQQCSCVSVTLTKDPQKLAALQLVNPKQHSNAHHLIGKSSSSSTTALSNNRTG
jgi:hypothetical protein